MSDNTKKTPRMTPEQFAAFDESSAALADVFPPTWKRMFDNCLSQGFNETDSLRLVQSYILSQCPFGVNGVK